MTDAAAAHELAPRIATALLDITAPDPARHTRVVLWTVSALFLVLVIWSMVAKVDIVAVAPGRLVPQTYVKVVQPADAGIIRELLVKPGETVRKGQILARLDATLAQADHRSIQQQLSSRRITLRRIDAQLSGVPLRQMEGDDPVLLVQAQADAAARMRSFNDQMGAEAAILARARSDLASAEEVRRKLFVTLPSYEREASAYADLAERQLVGRLAAEEKRRTATERALDLRGQDAYVASLRSAVDAQARKLSQVKSAYTSQLQTERTETASAIAQLEQETAKHKFRAGLQDLRAPQDGVVNEVATSSVGAVLRQGDVLMTLVPGSDPLVAEVYVENRDVGFVRVGQAVRVKLGAFQFTKYGYVSGTVESVSADSAAETGDVRGEQPAARSILATTERPYRVRVRLNSQRIAHGGSFLTLAPGMALQAEIVQGTRTIAEYMLSPLAATVATAAMER
jgi:hemolysin D